MTDTVRERLLRGSTVLRARADRIARGFSPDMSIRDGDADALADFAEAVVEALAASPQGEGSSADTPIEAVAWRYRYPNDPTWQLTLDRKQAHDKTGEVQPLYTHPAPIKTSADTGELRERVLEAKEWIDEAECRRGCSTWRPDVHGRSRCDCGREDALNALLDLFQSGRGE